ncbi:MAG: hypothetical protein GF401_10195 [Chitinivibrionales bacterium]|nr:hypothetical protein [Chitinivibrionales bacterium]
MKNIIIFFRHKTPVLLSILIFVVNTFSGRAYHVSATTGSQNGDGSLPAPFLRIMAAADRAQPGDTIMVHQGIYRGRIAPPQGGEPGSPIVYMAFPGDTVFLKGSNIWDPSWEALTTKANTFYASPDPALFTDDSQYDGANPFEIELIGSRSSPAATLGQVFVDGERMTEVDEEGKLFQGSWWYDSLSKNIYLCFPSGKNPDSSMVEITTQRRVFAPHLRELGYITVKGFIMEHCGNQYPASWYMPGYPPQAGLLGCRSGNHWVIENNVIRHAKGIGIDFGVESDEDDIERKDNTVNGSEVGYHLIRNNLITDNGTNGLMGCYTHNVRIVNNIIEGTNYLRIDGNEKGAIKTHGFNDGILEGNLFRNNKCQAIYLDAGFTGARVTKNIVVSNTAYGMMFELQRPHSTATLVDNNILVGNGYNSIYHPDASSVTYAHNLLAASSGSDGYGSYGEGHLMRIVTDRRSAQLYENRMYNTLFFRNFGGHMSWPFTDCVDDEFGECYSDYNVFTGSALSRLFFINKYCGGLRPWGDDWNMMIQMVCDDIGNALVGTAPQHKASNYRGAALTFSEWQAYWANNGTANDQNSIISSECKAAYNLLSNELTITIDYDPSSLSSQPVAGLDTDILGNAIPQDGTADPGPIQGLSKGVHTFQLWPPQDFPDFPLPAPLQNRAVNLPKPSKPLPAPWIMAPFDGRIHIPRGRKIKSIAVYSAGGRFISRITAEDSKVIMLDKHLDAAPGIRLVKFVAE